MKKSIITTLFAIFVCACMLFGFTACNSFTQEDIDKAVSEATAPLNEQITALQADIADKTAKIATLEGEKTALTTEKTELQEDIQEIEAEVTALETEKASLEADVADLEQEKASLTTEKAELEGQITSLNGTIAEKNSEIANLTSSISALNTEKATLTARVTELEASINEKDNEITSLTSSIETLMAEKQALSERVSELEAENAGLKNCLKGNHAFEVSYKWADDYSACTATQVCQRTHCGFENELSAASITVSGTKITATFNGAESTSVDITTIENQDYIAVKDENTIVTYVAYTEAGLLAWNTYAQTNTATNLVLANDITLTLAENATSNWTSVGTESAPYMGTVDGNGYSITGMTINQTTVDAGFIGHLGENGVVKNLKLKDVSVTSTADYVGGVVGRVNNSCVIENCVVEGGTVSSSGNHVGGIVGYESDDYSTNIIACYNTATVKGYIYTGGIIGRAGGAKIIACYNSGSISMTYPSTRESGGIVGFTGQGTPTVYCNYNTGATNRSVAIIGRVSRYISRNYNYWSSDHEYANGTNIAGDDNNYGATKITSASEWETAMTTMNTWLADNGYAYRYVLNTDAATKAAQPLIIVKVS